MKFTKLSLVAALAVSAAVAGGDIAPVEPAAKAPATECNGCGKITGKASLWYLTNDRGASVDLFDKNGAQGDAALRLDYTRNLFDGAVTFNAGIQMVSTLGLENELVMGTFVGHGPQPVQDAVWVDIFNAQFKVGNTAIIAGRQAIDTPFFYTETWNIAQNTFDAIVVANSDLPDTTLVGAWVGRGNGNANLTVMANNTDLNGGMTKFYGNPAYAFGAVTKLIPNTVAQAWYYYIPSVADAYWLQADVNVDGILFGAQYAGTSTSIGLADTDAWAVKLGYDAGSWNAWGAYSQRSDDNGLDISNIATNGGGTGGGQSKLYTEAYWAYGNVGARDAETFALGGSYDFGMATVNAQYTDMTSDRVADMNEFYVGTSFDLGPVDATLAYTSTAYNDGDRFNTLIVMLDMPFEL